jgi:hypothetical protein
MRILIGAIAGMQLASLVATLAAPAQASSGHQSVRLDEFAGGSAGRDSRRIDGLVAHRCTVGFADGAPLEL